ncbi:MAG: NUDIX domain-containing protein [Candidatus Saccharibacteria bacterium]|nr:NUDIX domain-containing protein [Candidatus Saccharibacteria bacterium]
MGHIHELYDFTASAFIVNDQRVLLIHHKKIGKWLQPGGHIELDEDPLQALYREIKEETGLTKDALSIIETTQHKRSRGKKGNNKILPLPFDINVHPFNDTHKHIDLCYLLTASHDTVVNEEDKAHDIGWFTLTEIKRLTARGLAFPDTLELATFALKYA